MSKHYDCKKKFTPLLIPKQDFKKKDEFDELYDEIDKLGEVYS